MQNSASLLGCNNIKILVADLASTPSENGLINEIIAACRLRADITCELLAEPPESQFNMELLKDSCFPAHVYEDMSVACVIVLDAGLLYFRLVDRGLLQPRPFIDLSLEPVPIWIWRRDPKLFKAIVSAFLIGRIANDLKPDQEFLGSFAKRLNLSSAPAVQDIDGYRQFGIEVLAIVGFQANRSGKIDDLADFQSDQWPIDLAIAGLNNRGTLLFFALRSGRVKVEKIDETAALTLVLLERAQTLAEKTDAPRLKRNMLNANRALVLNWYAGRLAATEPIRAKELQQQSETLLTSSIEELSRSDHHHPVQIRMLHGLAAILASVDRHQSPAVNNMRILALRRALKLCTGASIGDAARIRSELAAALLARPGVTTMANTKEALPHLRAASSIYRQSLGKAVGTNQKIYLFGSLIDTEIALHRLTRSKNHKDAAILAATELGDFLHSLGRNEECKMIEKLFADYVQSNAIAPLC